MAPFITAVYKRIFAIQSKRPDRSLDCVRVQFDAATIKEHG